MGAQVLVSDLDLNYGGGAAAAAAGGGGAAAYGGAPASGLASQGSYGQPAPRPAPQPAYGGHPQQPGMHNGGGYGQQQPGGGYYGQQPVVQQQPQQPAVSLIDQVPQQAPAYPYFQQGSSHQQVRGRGWNVRKEHVARVEAMVRRFGPDMARGLECRARHGV